MLQTQMDGKFIRTFLKNRSCLKFKFVENVYFKGKRLRRRRGDGLLFRIFVSTQYCQYITHKID